MNVAHAQPSTTDRERAVALFRDSDAHYKRGEFERAAALLREAYALHPEPLLLYNLARALEGLGDFVGAIEQYERYLNLATEIPDRGAIERRLETLRAQVAKPTATDGDPAARTTPLVSDTRTDGAIGVVPGTHEGDRRVDRGEPAMQASPRRLPWLIGGGGVVVLGTGVLFGYLSQARHDAAVDEPVQREAARLQDQASSYATLSTSALIVGGVAVVGGAAWAVLDRRRSRSSSTTIAGAHVDVGLGTVQATWVLP